MKEKLEYFVKKLGKLPDCRNDDFYRLADYIELKCLVNKDGEYSIAEFVDDASQRTEDLGEGDFEDNKETKKLSKSQKNDKWETIAKDTFRVIESRVKVYDENYPFELTENRRGIVLKKSLESCELYLFLLLCSDLRYTLKFKKELTSSFELACLEVWRRLFPNSEVRLFGSSNTEEEDSEWKSDKLWDKLSWMETFLAEKLRIEKDEISKYDKGDRGLDLVGKVTLEDNLSNFPILFGQCACSPKDWVKKQHSMKFDAWDGLISLSTYPNCFMFIPQSFRNAKGEWHDRTQIHKTVLVDRHRIISNFENTEVFNNLSSKPVLDAIVQTKESVF
ncbi:MAG: hypothetical protein HRT61_15000 [Ekhidna sp.]|nr:hypothetical protein [Ekhidna sp.]